MAEERLDYRLFMKQVNDGVYECICQVKKSATGKYNSEVSQSAARQTYGYGLDPTKKAHYMVYFISIV